MQTRTALFFLEIIYIFKERGDPVVKNKFKFIPMFIAAAAVVLSLIVPSMSAKADPAQS